MFHISGSVVELYKNEMELKEGDALQFYVRYAGGSSGGYGLGVSRGEPADQDLTQKVDGITFFVKPDDVWFFEDLKLDYDTKQDRFICDSPSVA